MNDLQVGGGGKIDRYTSIGDYRGDYRGNYEDNY